MRSMRSISMLGAALGMASVRAGSPLFVDDWPTDPKPRKRNPLRGPAPNDFGPVVDSTPESKRARRRRLAKAGSAA